METLDIQHIEEENNTTETAETLPGFESIARQTGICFCIVRTLPSPNSKPWGSNSYYHCRPMLNLTLKLWRMVFLLGNGELVQMNDTLGVEIHEWLSESGNGE
ncbi:surface presentation of antigens protein SpaO [Salmonella sp. NCTC 11881]|nr:surface presentation of antigens protein SpaO [Salmonella sp. NCTC 11881]